jgi:hypothetical protein
VTLNGYAIWAGCTEVVGIPQGGSFANIRWEDRPKDRPARQIYSEMSDANNLTISCTRPLYGADPSAAYRYVWWHRQPKS